MAGDCQRSTFPGPRRYVLSCWLTSSFVLPPLVVGPRQHRRRGRPEIGDGGNQGDQLILTVAGPVRNLVLDHPHIPGQVPVQFLPRRAASVSSWRRAALIPGLTSTDRYEPSGSSSSGGSKMPDLTRHSSAAPVPAAAHQSFQL